MEEFRWIKGFEGAFKISNLGRVLSVDRIDCGGYHRRERFLSVKIDHYGYFRVCLSLNGKNYTRKIHRLIAEAFIPNPENKPEVDHIDGNKLNNDISNLRWATSKENMNNPITHARMSDSGKKNATYGQKSGFARIVGQYTLDGELIATYESAGRAAVATGIGWTSIRGCIAGRSKTAGGFIWKPLSEAKIKPRWGRKKGFGGKAVIQYTADGVFVAEYESIGLAADKTGFCASSISLAAKGIYKYCKGFIWKYKDSETNNNGET